MISTHSAIVRSLKGTDQRNMNGVRMKQLRRTPIHTCIQEKVTVPPVNELNIILDTTVEVGEMVDVTPTTSRSTTKSLVFSRDLLNPILFKRNKASADWPTEASAFMSTNAIGEPFMMPSVRLEMAKGTAATYPNRINAARAIPWAVNMTVGAVPTTLWRYDAKKEAEKYTAKVKISHGHLILISSMIVERWM